MIFMLGNGNLVLIDDNELYYTIHGFKEIEFSLTKGVFDYIFKGALFLGYL